MTIMKLHKAIVIDDVDPLKLSRVQVRITPELKDVEEDLLPWASPHGGQEMSGSAYTHNPPAIGTFVWVYFLDEYWQEPYYFSGRFIEGLFDYDSVESTIGGVSEVGSSTYPNPKFVLYDDGSVVFRNTDNGAMGMISSNGSYILIGAGGEIVFDGPEIHLNGTSKSLVTHAELDSALQSLVTSLQTELGKIATGISGAGGAYTPGTLTLDISSSEAASLKTDG